MKRWATPAVIPLICLFGGFLAGGLRDPLSWTAVGAVIWLTALAFPFSWPPAPDLKLWGLWLGWSALSLLASDQPFKGVFSFCRWLTIIVFFAMIRSYWKEEDHERWLEGLPFLGFVLGFAVLFVEIPGYPMVGLLPPYYNYTTFILAALSAAALGVLERFSVSIGDRKTWIFAVLLLFCLAIILIAHSRSGLWAISAAVAAWLVRRRKIRLLLGLLLALPVLTALLSPEFISRFAKQDTVGGFKRLQIWKTSLQITADHPLLGEGPGNFEQGFTRHNFPSGFASRYGLVSNHAHSEVLEVAAETGWVGLGLFLAAILASLRRFLHGAKPTLVQEAAFYASMAMSAQGLVDNMLHMPSLALFFFSALACAPDHIPEHNQISNRRLPRWLFLAGLLLSLAAWIPQKLVQTYLERYWEDHNPERRLDLAGRCLRLFPKDPYCHELAAYAWLDIRPPQARAASKALEQAGQLNPTNALYPKLRGDILLQEGRPSEALALAELALDLEPNYQGARLLRAETLARMGHKKQASEELALILRQRLPLSRVEAHSGYDRTLFSFDQRRYEVVRRLVSQSRKKKVK